MLPILEIARPITDSLRKHNRLVLAAPTGSGKTTQVPQILMRNGGIDGQIIVLQPRRLATRLVARRVAHEMDVPLGTTVGYQTRHESQLGPETVIRFMTEGLLLRIMQSNPTLRGVGAVLLDEFHERSLATDMALGLLKRLQERDRPDLRLIVMSATLDTGAVSGFLRCPVLEAAGRLFAVDIEYLPHHSVAPVWDMAADALGKVVQSGAPGDVLIFMPGAYEIRRTIEAIGRRVTGGVPGGLAVFPLYSALPVEQQDAALSPCDRRRVIVSTNVAETSITIEGIVHVIDSGLARIHRYDARRGINVLRVERISQASVTQRAGRAGRTQPGRCVRLWTAMTHGGMAEHEAPEVRRLDLAQAMLHLQSLGEPDFRAFPWLDAPEEPAVARAAGLLRDLKANDAQGRITPLGRKMAHFPLHPRLAAMLIEAEDRLCLARACLWAALISERELTSGPVPARFVPPPPEVAGGKEPVSDLVALEKMLEAAVAGQLRHEACRAVGVNPFAARDVEQTRKLFLGICRRAKMELGEAGDTTELLKALLVGFADHLAILKDSHNRRCAMPGQRNVMLDKNSLVKRPGLILALDASEIGRGNDTQTTLSLASEIEPVWVEELMPERVIVTTTPRWNSKAKGVEAIEERAVGGLVFETISRPTAPPEAAAGILVEKLVRGELKLDQWDERIDQWIQRVRCVRLWFPERPLIEYTDEQVRVVLHELVAGATRYSQIKDRPVLEAFKNALPWDDQRFVEQMAPAEIRLPTRFKMKIAYQAGSPPRGRARIADLYDFADTPTVADGRVKLLMEILAPNQRPVQVTDNLAGFWKNLYPQVKKELARKYPTHRWK